MNAQKNRGKVIHHLPPIPEPLPGPLVLAYTARFSKNYLIIPPDLSGAPNVHATPKKYNFASLSEAMRGVKRMSRSFPPHDSAGAP
jgi:hypothetical protein